MRISSKYFTTALNADPRQLVLTQEACLEAIICRSNNFFVEPRQMAKLLKSLNVVIDRLFKVTFQLAYNR